MSMRNGKKWLGVTMALCMAMPSMTAFASQSAAPTGGSTTGVGGVELESGKPENFKNVILPTISSETYSFMIDPFGALNKYDPDTYSTAKTAYFTKVDDAATFAGADAGTTTDGQVYTITYTAEADSTASAAALQTEVRGGSTTSIALAGTKTYAVWVPDPDDKPQGKFVDITAANIEQYCTITKGTTDYSDATVVMKAGKAGDIFDGVVYEKKYEALATTTDASEYVVKQADGTLKLAPNAETIYTTTDNTTYTAVTDTNINTVIEYTDATTKQEDTSDVVTIENKSSYALDVTAKITLQNGDLFDGFSTDGSFDAADKSASIFMAVTDGTNTEYVGTTDVGGNVDYTAELTFNLTGASDPDNDYNLYRGGVNPATGGHFYEYYLKQDVTYNSGTFQITAGANNAGSTAASPDADTKAAWEAYIDKLEAAYEADSANPKVPKVDVVYNIAYAGETPTSVGSVMWNSQTGDLWFAINATGKGGFADHDLLTAASVLKADGTYGNIDLAKIKFDNNEWASITWADLTGAGQDDATSVVTLKITYNGVNYVVNAT